MRITIVYWSSTGNTEKMAELIGEGLRTHEVELVIKHVSEAHQKDIIESDLMLLGCSAMGVEDIDTSEMEPFIRANASSFKHQKLALFGSYGWGDGEWIEEWEKTMEGLGAILVSGSLMINEKPTGDSAQECIAYGQAFI